MTKDAMRAELITRFFCAECGSVLNTTYDTGNQKPRHVSSDPTGAAVRYNNISIIPCNPCISKHTGPAKRLAAAIKDMEASNDGS